MREAHFPVQASVIGPLVTGLVGANCGGRPGACAPFLEYTLPRLPDGVAP